MCGALLLLVTYSVKDLQTKSHKLAALGDDSLGASFDKPFTQILGSGTSLFRSPETLLIFLVMWTNPQKALIAKEGELLYFN